MGNMSYCRFVNTLEALRDCEEHMFDEDMSPEEAKARDRLAKLCRRIADDVEDSE